MSCGSGHKCVRISLAIFSVLGTILSGFIVFFWFLVLVFGDGIAGFGFALLSSALGMLSCCCLCSDKRYCSLVIIYVFAAMSQGLTFINLLDAELDGGEAVIFPISAIIVWLLCAILAWISKIENETEEQAEEQMQHCNNEPIIAKAVFASEEPIVNETVTVREDGTRVIERLTMFPDDSQEITTTEVKLIENPAKSPV